MFSLCAGAPAVQEGTEILHEPAPQEGPETLHDDDNDSVESWWSATPIVGYAEPDYFSWSQVLGCVFVGVDTCRQTLQKQLKACVKADNADGGDRFRKQLANAAVREELGMIPLSDLKQRVLANGGPARLDCRERLPLHYAAQWTDAPFVEKLALALNSPPSSAVRNQMEVKQISVDLLDQYMQAPMTLAQKILTRDALHPALSGGALRTARAGNPLRKARAGSALRTSQAGNVLHTACARETVAVLLENGSKVKLSRFDVMASVLTDRIEETDAWEHLIRYDNSNEMNRAIGLYAYRVKFVGSVLEREGGECIVSFPGKYSKLWQRLADNGKAGNLSAAVVFLPEGCEQFGQHATDPDCLKHARPDDTRAKPDDCLCKKLYGRKERWGCMWCQEWMYNVRKAYNLGQKLVVLFFKGETGDGVVTWEELPLKAGDKRIGKGLGNSQRGEVAFLLKEYGEENVVYRDIQDFANSMGAPLE